MKQFTIHSKKHEPQIVTVDKEDIVEVSKFKWLVYKGHGSVFYVYRYNEGKSIQLHRTIMNPPDNMEVDHINGNPLDNRKSNLRVCFHFENAANRKRHVKVNHMYGVEKKRNKYRAQTLVLGKKMRSSLFTTEVEAAYMYDWLARIVHGEFATQNFTDQKSYTIPEGVLHEN